MKTILILIGAVIIAAGAYFYMSGDDADTMVNTDDTMMVGDAMIVEEGDAMMEETPEAMMDEEEVAQ